jgi:hypothetical protein
MVGGEETPFNGYDYYDFVWIRTLLNDGALLYGTAPHPQESWLESIIGNALKMI